MTPVTEEAFPGMDAGGATLSEDDRYRYRLWRTVAPLDTTCLFIMLNPSTADHRADDPTIRRCVDFTRRLGHGRLEVVNLYAWRATSPKELAAAADPTGPRNAEHVAAAIQAADQVIAAWGTFVDQMVRAGHPPMDVRPLVADAGMKLTVLGLSEKGHPRHPLYLLADSTPRVWVP